MRVTGGVVGIVFCLLVVASAAQDAGSTRPQTLTRLDFLEGRWRVTGTMGTESVDEVVRCEWMSRVMMCRGEQSTPGGWTDVILYSYNDRTQRYEGAFIDGIGQVARHPVRWEGSRMISEHEYYVADAHRFVRRTIVPQADDSFLWIIEDLADDKVQVAFQLKHTRLKQ